MLRSEPWRILFSEFGKQILTLDIVSISVFDKLSFEANFLTPLIRSAILVNDVARSGYAWVPAIFMEGICLTPDLDSSCTAGCVVSSFLSVSGAKVCREYNYSEAFFCGSGRGNRMCQWNIVSRLSLVFKRQCPMISLRTVLFPTFVLPTATKWYITFSNDFLNVCVSIELPGSLKALYMVSTAIRASCILVSLWST